MVFVQRHFPFLVLLLLVFAGLPAARQHAHADSESGPALEAATGPLLLHDQQPLSCAGHAHAGSAHILRGAEAPTPQGPASAFLPKALAPSGLRYTMDWRAHRPLIWEDFRGHPQPATGVDAVSSCGIRCDPELRRDGSLRFSVNAYFSHDDSWVDGRDASDYLLVHEQRHFDLAELYARKLRKELQATRFQRGKLNQQIQQAYDRNFRAYKKAQHTYDSESAHSTDLEAQKRWDRWIQDELYRHRHWAGSAVLGRVDR